MNEYLFDTWYNGYNFIFIETFVFEIWLLKGNEVKYYFQIRISPGIYFIKEARTTTCMRICYNNKLQNSISNQLGKRGVQTCEHKIPKIEKISEYRRFSLVLIIHAKI